MMGTTMMTATTLKNMWSVLQARLLHSFLHSLCFSSLLQQWTPLPWTLHTWSHSVTATLHAYPTKGVSRLVFLFHVRYMSKAQKLS